MAIHRVTMIWQGFQGAPGYTNLFFTGGGGDAQADADFVRSIGFLTPLVSIIPVGVSIRVSTEVAVIDQENGQVQEFINLNRNPTPLQGSGAGGFSSASGAVINWLTAGVRNGRRVSGRTFLVPLASGAYQNDGTLTPAALTALNNAGVAMIGNGFESGFGVWSRPTGAQGGAFYEATGHRVIDKVAVLRSRRD